MNPLVSVIVPTYNRKELLTYTIRSILNQTYQNIELIVVDNFSDYDIISHIATFNDYRLSLFQNSNHGIIAINRNFGTEKAKGTLIAFCDDDDLWAPEKLAKQIQTIANNSLCCTNRKYINNNNEVIPHRALLVPRKLSLFNFLCSNFVTLSSVLIKKDILKKYKGFTSLPEFRYSEDYELWGRMLAGGEKFIICKEKLVLYRLHQSNLSKNLHEGIKRTIAVNNSLFNKYKVPFSTRIISTTVNYVKLSYYVFKKWFNIG